MITQQLAALGDPVRWQLLQLLIQFDGSLYVEELAHIVGKSQPTVSHHLRILRLAGLLSTERNTTYHFYHVRLDTLAEVEQALAQLHAMESVA